MPIMFRVIVFLCLLLLAPSADAASKERIDRRVAATLKDFYAQNPVAKALGAEAKGVLVFPRVYKAGFIGGGEYGEGSLLVGNQPVDYYSTASASFGFQFGAQARTQILMFMTDQALKEFRRSDGWEAGVDGSVALINVGGGKDFDTNSLQSPIVGFVANNDGLMLNVSLEGTKISKISR